MLEEQVIPRFYEHTSGGLPRAWVEMVQEAWATLGPRVTAARMVRDYTTDLYEPAAAVVRDLTADDGAAAELADVAAPGAGVLAVGVDHVARRRQCCRHGASRPVTVTVAMDGLAPGDVRVDVLHGTVGPDGEFRPATGDGDAAPTGDGTYRGDLVLTAPGSYGVTARVIPVHPALASPYELGLATWAG